VAFAWTCSFRQRSALCSRRASRMRQVQKTLSVRRCGGALASSATSSTAMPPFELFSLRRLHSPRSNSDGAHHGGQGRKARSWAAHDTLVAVVLLASLPGALSRSLPVRSPEPSDVSAGNAAAPEGGTSSAYQRCIEWWMECDDGSIRCADKLLGTTPPLDTRCFFLPVLPSQAPTKASLGGDNSLALRDKEPFADGVHTASLALPLAGPFPPPPTARPVPSGAGDAAAEGAESSADERPPQVAPFAAVPRRRTQDGSMTM
jgi:hypothetical protein